MASKGSNCETRYAEQLGQPADKAQAILRRRVMLALIQKAGLDCCARCGARLVDPDDIALDHVVPWRNSQNPKKLFWDLDNVRFSHKHCNIEHSLRRKSKAEKRARENARRRERYRNDPEFAATRKAMARRYYESKKPC